MQSSTNHCDYSYISLGERRGISDLARFSLDLSWAREVSDGARSRAYPSPPMSGSPPLPPSHHTECSDQGHGGYRSTGQDVFRGTHTAQSAPESLGQSRAPLLQPYQQDPHPSTPYPLYQMEVLPIAQQYQHPRQQMPLPSQHSYLSHPSQPPVPFPLPSRQPVREATEYSSPKAQRKTKGHVASACVPCKRAHLRCDAQRPCSRCLSNGKEDTCVDVQHKKRGRPRLRDERDPRYEGIGPNYQPSAQGPMRRPISLYSPGDIPVSTPFGDSLLHRSGSYRVLKSQGGGPMARYPENVDTPIYAGQIPPTPRMLAPQDLTCAYLTMDLQISKATQGFGEAIGVQSVTGRKLLDIVAPVDRDKVFRLQRLFEDERRDREPNYLPPIYPKYEEDRIIQSVGFGPNEMAQFTADRPEMFTFQGPDGQQRTFQVRFSLAKKDSTYFISLMLHIPATPQTYHQPSSSPFSRESYSRDSQYGYQTPQQGFPQTPSASPYMPNPPFGDSRGDSMYRPSGPMGSNIPPATIPPYVQSQTRPEYPQPQNPYQTPRSELPQAQPQHQHDLQLPPIRDQRGEGPLGGQLQPRLRDDRSGRVDIGGLLEKPDPARRGS